MKSDKPMKILAVDNEIHMLKLLERIISEKTPFDIETTNNVLECPDLIKKNTYDLIISDLKMPGMDGLELLQHVMEHGHGEEFIMITAFGTFETANKALDLGALDYITKPFRKEQIIAAVNRAMRIKAAQREIEQLSGIFKVKPFSYARDAFEVQYIHRMMEEYDGDSDLVAELSGLSEDRVVKLSVDVQ